MPLAALGLACVLSLVLPSQALAAYPGLNGRIVFGRFDGMTGFDQVYSVNPNGSAPVNLSNDATQADGLPSVSGDGKLIAFQRRIAGGGAPPAIWVMNSDGSGKRQLTTPPSGFSDGMSAISPDGRKVVFERDPFPFPPDTTPALELLYVINVDGTGLHQLTTPPSGFSDETPTWSPDGMKVAFMREPTDDSGGQITVVNSDGTGATAAVTHPPSGYKDTDPNFSPDGSKLVFTRSQAAELNVPSDVLVINVNGTGETALTSETGTNESEDPAFSPDGTLIVYGRYTAGSPNSYKQLWTMKAADGSNKTALTPADPTNGTQDSTPNWAPLPAPTLSGLGVSPNKFSIAGRKVKGKCVKPTKKNKGHKSCRRAIKLKISYTLSITATVVFTLKGSAPGRKVKGKCVKPTKKNKKKKKCTRTLNVNGSITRASTAGANSFAFDGKVGGKKLKPGTYVLTAIAAANGKTSTAQTATFKIAG